MRRILAFSAFAFLLLSTVSVAQKKPNIILIMSDDMGFSDIGAYGSEIETPNIDKLATSGVRLRQFYNMAKCAPSRSSLLTGQNIGNDKAISISQALRKDYFTIMCGKEHLEDWVPENVRVGNSFHRSFMNVGNEHMIPPSGKMSTPFEKNGKKIKESELEYSGDSFYKADAETDYALRWLNEAKTEDKPFFLYMAYHVAHYPLQAPPAEISKYSQTYKVGWDVIRKQRYEKMKQLGIISDKYKLTPPSSNINEGREHPDDGDPRRKLIPIYRPWEELTPKEKDELSFEMAVYAAMIDRMDQNIGRLIKWLKDNGEYENTVIMYFTDNGPSPYDSNHNFNHPPGGAASFRSLSAAWANVAATPFKYFKQFGHEGGSNTHFVFHWPAKIKSGKILDGPGHITDIFPTILDIAGLDYPQEMNGSGTLPLVGTSLVPLMVNGSRTPPAFLYSGHTEKFRSYRVGDWKIVRVNKGEWELYNLRNDPTEMNNLAAQNATMVVEMDAAYELIKKQYDKWLSKK
jgi:arylsulfatase